jgi:hypothetical protein
MLNNLLSRLLFYVTLLGAGALALFVLIAPLLVSWNVADARLVQLYADDTTVRRTSLGAAVGLAVTAYFCFRPKRQAPEPEKKA